MNANLRSPLQRRLAGAERGSRVRQDSLKRPYDRVRAAEDTPRSPFRALERRHGLAEIVECGGGVVVERLCVKPPHPKRDIMIISENASRHGHRFSQQRFGFFEAP